MADAAADAAGAEEGEKKEVPNYDVMAPALGNVGAKRAAAYEALNGMATGYNAAVTELRDYVTKHQHFMFPLKCNADGYECTTFEEDVQEPAFMMNWVMANYGALSSGRRAGSTIARIQLAMARVQAFLASYGALRVVRLAQARTLTARQRVDAGMAAGGPTLSEIEWDGDLSVCGITEAHMAGVLQGYGIPEGVDLGDGEVNHRGALPWDGADSVLTRAVAGTRFRAYREAVLKASETSFLDIRVARPDVPEDAEILYSVSMSDEERIVMVSVEDMVQGAELIFEEDRASITRSAGCLMVAIPKCVLYKQGHHFQATEACERAYEALVGATGLGTFLAEIRMTTSGAASLWGRVLSHPFFGWVAGLLSALTGGAAGLALTIRMAGWGAGWAKVGAVWALITEAARDRALDLTLTVLMGTAWRELVDLVIEHDLPVLNGPHPRYSMVVSAFVPGQGGNIPGRIRTLVDEHAEALRAGVDCVGGTLSGVLTFGSATANSRAAMSLHRSLVAKLALKVTAATVDALNDLEKEHQVSREVLRKAMASPVAYKAGPVGDGLLNALFR